MGQGEVGRAGLSPEVGDREEQEDNANDGHCQLVATLGHDPANTVGEVALCTGRGGVEVSASTDGVRRSLCKHGHQP